MATRIFCDHCGNTITTPNVFCYGPWSEVQEIAYTATRGSSTVSVAQSGGGAGGYQVMVSGAAVEKLIKVDLCNTCVAIWMERVRNLTKASDADV